MSRGSTELNGFPCPQCSKRSHVTKSLPAEGGLFRRYRKCASGCRGFWTSERVEGTHPSFPKPKRLTISRRQMTKRFEALDPKRRGLLWRMMQIWSDEDASAKEPAQ